MKLTYWMALCESDSPVYSIKETTKKKVIEQLENYHDLKKVERDSRYSGEGEYSDVFKVELEYDNGLDLLKMATGEGSIGQEYMTDTEYCWVSK